MSQENERKEDAGKFPVKIKIQGGEFLVDPVSKDTMRIFGIEEKELMELIKKIHHFGKSGDFKYSDFTISSIAEIRPQMIAFLVNQAFKFLHRDFMEFHKHDFMSMIATLLHSKGLNGVEIKLGDGGELDGAFKESFGKIIEEALKQSGHDCEHCEEEDCAAHSKAPDDIVSQLLNLTPAKKADGSEAGKLPDVPDEAKDKEDGR